MSEKTVKTRYGDREISQYAADEFNNQRQHGSVLESIDRQLIWSSDSMANLLEILYDKGIIDKSALQKIIGEEIKDDNGKAIPGWEPSGKEKNGN